MSDIAHRPFGQIELSPQERRAGLCVAEGLKGHEIALVLGVGVRTAKAHVENGMAKLGASNRAHYVALMYERGLLVPGQVAHSISILVVTAGLMLSLLGADDALRPRTPRRTTTQIVRMVGATRMGVAA